MTGEEALGFPQFPHSTVESMDGRLIVVDNFYANPAAVVNVATHARFDRSGRYSHFERTASFFPRNAIEIFESLLSCRIRIDKSWTAPRKSSTVNGDTFNGTFYRVPESARSPTHVHHDGRDWIGIVWLGDSAPASDGTAFFRHRRTGATGASEPVAAMGDEATRRDGSDLTKWVQTHFVANRFNRLLLYEGRRYHRACISNPGARLCQLFSFNQEGSGGIRRASA
jgi:hypothetical protein